MTVATRVKCTTPRCASFGKRISSTRHRHRLLETQPLTPRERMQRYAAQNSSSVRTLSCSYVTATGEAVPYGLTSRQAQQVYRQVKRTATGFVAHRDGGGVTVREIA